MPRYNVLVDGERVARLHSEDEIRDWVAHYRGDHLQDDPDATHVQVVELRWMGGRLLPIGRFRRGGAGTG